MQHLGWKVPWIKNEKKQYTVLYIQILITVYLHFSYILLLKSHKTKQKKYRWRCLQVAWDDYSDNYSQLLESSASGSLKTHWLSGMWNFKWLKSKFYETNILSLSKSKSQKKTIFMFIPETQQSLAKLIAWKH